MALEARQPFLQLLDPVAHPQAPQAHHVGHEHVGEEAVTHHDDLAAADAALRKVGQDLVVAPRLLGGVAQHRHASVALELDGLGVVGIVVGAGQVADDEEVLGRVRRQEALPGGGVRRPHLVVAVARDAVVLVQHDAADLGAADAEGELHRVERRDGGVRKAEAGAVEKPQHVEGGAGVEHATPGASAARASAAGEALNDDDVCIICASPIRYAALLPCNHRVCHVCAMRQRALYRKHACLVCRTECPRIVITEQLERAFGDFGGAPARHDAAHAVDFTSARACDDTMRLLALDCGVCGRALELFAALLEHVREAHHRYFCGICAANRKAFVGELALFTLKQLQRHQGEGDEQGFAGHPECKHCRGRRFYSDDELNVHVRDCHERCHICDQRDPRGAAYYKNYDALFAHFGRAHYVCTVALCLEKKFVVFREELDLTAHMLKEHGGLGGRAVVGAAPRYRLQLSTFEHPLARAPASAGAGADAADSADTQRKRLEERARHYLSYDADKVRQFLLLNKRLRARAVTPRDLLAGYRALFAGTTQGDLLLLVHEVAELLPESADRRELAAIADELAAAETAADKFPRLNGATLSTANIHAWGRLLPGVERFPALPKAKPPAKVVAKQPIRYTTVVKAQPRVTTAAAPAAYKPTYLDRLRLASELPVLGRSLPDPKFPTLPKKAAKKPLLVFEPVTPAPWGPRSGSGSSTPREPSADLDFGVPVVVKKKKGKK